MTELPFISEGAQVVASGQTFTAIEVKPYARRDGQPSQLVTWRSGCSVCGTVYETLGSRGGGNLPLTCPAHRGQRVRRRPRAADAVRALRRLVRSAMTEMRNARHQAAYGHLEAALLITGKSPEAPGGDR